MKLKQLVNGLKIKMKKIFFLFLFGLFFVSFIGAAGFTETVSSNFNDFVDSPLVYIKMILGYQGTSLSLYGAFFLGIFSASFLFFNYHLILFIRYLFFTKAKRLRAPEEDFEGIFSIGRYRWIDLIAGRLWKIFLIGVFFVILTFVPLINRVFEFITLTTFGVNFFFRIIWMIFLLGWGPFVIDNWMVARQDAKYQEGMDAVARSKIMAKQTRSLD